jgi:hypothetical protein
MARVIEIVVSPKGEKTVQTKGFAGDDCLEASQFREKYLASRLPIASAANTS